MYLLDWCAWGFDVSLAEMCAPAGGEKKSMRFPINIMEALAAVVSLRSLGVVHGRRIRI